MGPGVHTIVLEIVTSLPVLQTNVQPSQITVTLEEQASKQVPVTLIQQGHVPGFEVMSIPIEETVEITGPVRDVQRVVAAQVLIELTIATNTAVTELPFELVPVDLNSQAVNRVWVEPSVVTVRMDFQQRPNTRILRLDPVIINAPPIGYRITDVSLAPESIIVQGSPEILADLPNLLPVGPIDVGGLITDVELLLPVALPDVNVQIINPEPLKVTIRVERPGEQDGENDRP
jgi:YbbR domain-containing protein